MKFLQIKTFKSEKSRTFAKIFDVMISEKELNEILELIKCVELLVI
jgi:hypothetical protein